MTKTEAGLLLERRIADTIARSLNGGAPDWPEVCARAVLRTLRRSKQLVDAATA